MTCAPAAPEVKPTQAYADPLKWFTPGSGMANPTEVLFMALLMVYAADSKAELVAWATQVLLEERRAAELGPNWSPPAGVAGWKGRGPVPAPLWQPIKAAYDQMWSTELLNQLGLAIGRWAGPEAYAGLCAGHLKRHKQEAFGFKSSPKDPKPGARWRTGAICQVAAMVKHRHAELEAGLLTTELPLPVAAVQLLAAMEQQAKLKDELKVEQGRVSEAKTEAKRARDAHRLAAARLKTKNKAVTVARREERREVTKKVRAAKAAMSAAQKQAIGAACATAREKISVEVQQAFTKRLEAARKRARDAEVGVDAMRKLKARTLKAESTVKDLRVSLDNAKAEVEKLSRPTSPTTITKTRRRDDHGRWEAEVWRLRWLKWAQLARRTPPSAIGRNIADVASVFAPHESYAEPCEAEARALRAEMTIAGEVMAAFQVAQAIRILSFGFDETTKFGNSVLSTNIQVVRPDGTTIDIVLRGAFLIPGGTAVQVAASIEKDLFAHCRRLLCQWRSKHEELHGVGSWERDGGACPDNIGLHRLSEHTLLISDTCNAARCARRLLGTMAVDAAVERIGTADWEALSEQERGEKVANYQGDCYQHLRNILINAMAAGATDFLKDELADSLSEFSSFDRMSADGMDLIRAICNELHPVRSVVECMYRPRNL